MFQAPEFAHIYRVNRAPRGADFFPPYFEPTIQTVDDRLGRSELCYGVVDTQESRAYPFSTLSKIPGGVLNDQLSSLPIVVVYDNATKSAVGFSRMLDGQKLEFERDSTGELRERTSDSVFNRSGRGIAGPLEGKQLAIAAGMQAEWYGWFAAFPNTDVYAGPTPTGGPTPTDE